MDLFLFKYLMTLYALCLVILTVLVLKINSLHTCVRFVKLCRMFGRTNIHGSIINGLTAFIVLCYCQSVFITFQILLISKLHGKNGQIKRQVPLFAGDIEYMLLEHFKYVTPALLCLLFIILPPPILLLTEPLLVQLSGLLKKKSVIAYCFQKV